MRDAGNGIKYRCPPTQLQTVNMLQELLAVVDDQDCVVDYRPRHVIHAEGLKHRAVHMLVFNDMGHLFLQKRSMRKDLNAGLWDTSAARHVDAGEDYDTSAIRELAEELGITDVDHLELLFKLTPTAATGMEFIQVYRYFHNDPLSLAADEIDDGTWIHTNDVNKRVLADDQSLTETFKRLWRQLLDNG